jgi:hypothetical protein
MLAALSKVYKAQNHSESLGLIVNAVVRVIEGAETYSNWNRETNGHDVILTVPEDRFVRILDRRQAIQNAICADLNKFHSSEYECFAHVIIELADPPERDWRLESGMLDALKRTVTVKTANRIWGDSGFRLFLSHKSEVKKKAADLKEKLSLFGVCAFVAHEDIVPTKEWQYEIEAALESMDAFVALLTKDFHDSEWTDQEVGYAVARSIPMISVKLGRDPYGFIGKFQGLRCSWEEAPVQIVKLLIKNPRMVDAYIGALPACGSFADGIELSKLLPEIEALTDTQVSSLLQAFSGNVDLNGCWGFNGKGPGQYGKGLAFHLSRITGRQYQLTDARKIERL